jgi:hypothetical protein
LLIWFTGNGAFEEMIAGSLENLKALIEQEAQQNGNGSPQIDDVDGFPHETGDNETA